MKPQTSRRRFLSICAGSAAAGLAPFTFAGTAKAGEVREWSGVALGADASISLAGFKADESSALLDLCRDEIDRQESLFSLYRPDSVISHLNKNGFLIESNREVIALVSTALDIARLTDGAFDPTVQPLWQLYSDYFSGSGDSRPAPEDITRAHALVDYRGIEVTGESIALDRPGMAITLNGIAQGYITDQVTALLKRHGAEHVLVNMGEYAALGRHPSGGAWRIGIRDPRNLLNMIETMPLRDAALATSGGYGTVFDQAGRVHHLFDPKTGLSSNRYLSVSVRHPRATLADAFSTAFSAMDENAIRDVVSKVEDMRVLIVRRDGETLTLGTA